MKINLILASVYKTSSIVIIPVMLTLCIIFHWSLQMTLFVLFTSLVISAPAVISLNAICWMLRRIEVTIPFAWMILFASIPLLVMLPAVLLVNALPGDEGFLVLMGVVSGYAGVLCNGVPIAQLFKSLL